MVGVSDARPDHCEARHLCGARHSTGKVLLGEYVCVGVVVDVGAGMCLTALLPHALPVGHQRVWGETIDEQMQ